MSNVHIDPFLHQVYRLSEDISAEDQQRILHSLQLMLKVIPPQGVNNIIVSHNFPEGIGVGHIPDMGTVIIRPMGQGYEVVAKLSLTDLLKLERFG